ncbi:hypothetical protein [Pseudogracilibacillus sp. SO30301A]|uniref:hypothetical protein n=1 Tax=Pseudogracilibacillus sp. SO30301A TaxID=3098291 RepID=UPI00300E4514
MTKNYRNLIMSVMVLCVLVLIHNFFSHESYFGVVEIENRKIIDGDFLMTLRFEMFNESIVETIEIEKDMPVYYDRDNRVTNIEMAWDQCDGRTTYGAYIHKNHFPYNLIRGKYSMKSLYIDS